MNLMLAKLNLTCEMHVQIMNLKDLSSKIMRHSSGFCIEKGEFTF